MADSLDIEELNRTRIALGMAPLPTPNKSSSNLEFKTSGSAEPEEDRGSTLESREAMGYDNWKKLQDEQDSKKSREAQRVALKKARDAAQKFAKLEGKGLGDVEDEEMDTRAWLLSSNKRRKKIEKVRTRALEQELEERERMAQYTEKDLAGLKVGHEIGDFDEGTEHIITLKDRAIGEEDDEDDVLESTDLKAMEDLAQRLELKKKKVDYDPHADDETGERSVLGKYDGEIKGKKNKRFTLNGEGRTIEASSSVQADEGTKNLGMKFSLDSLQDDSKPVSDYMDVSEVKIRKPKKKKEKSKRQREEDDSFAPAEPVTPAADAMDVDGAGTNGMAESNHTATATKPQFDQSFIDDEDLQTSLAKQRCAALKKRKLTRPEELARQLRDEEQNAMDVIDSVENEEGGLILDETSEFVANLQKPEAPPPRTFSSTKPSSGAAAISASPAPADPEGDIDMDHPEHDPDHSYDSDAASHQNPEEPNLTTVRPTGLEEEETLETGLGSTLKMLTGRGLLQPASSDDLNAQFRSRQRFLQEKHRRSDDAFNKARAQRERDRASGKFDRMSAREREQYAQYENKARDQAESRAVADVFNREYKPSVELKYVDEFGRRMDQREAFKHLSHQFHGKGSGKAKTEKRLKKIEDEGRKMAQSSLDASGIAGGIERAQGSQARKQGKAGVRLQ